MIRVLLETFSSGAYLVINKELIKMYGAINALFLSNLIDKFRYFLDKNNVNSKAGFFLTYEDQTEQIGLSKHQLREAKQFFIEKGILYTKKEGIPAKEFYYINLETLLQTYQEQLSLKYSEGIPQEVKNFNHKGLKNLTSNIIKENKYKDNKKSIIKNNTKKSLDFVPIEERDYFDTILHNLWLPYKDEQGKGYKSKQSYDILKKHLLEYSGGDKKKAKKVLERSMGNNWAGIFPYQEEGSQGKQSYKKPKGQVLTKPISEMTEEEIEEYNSRGHLFLNHDQKNNSYLDREPDFIV